MESGVVQIDAGVCADVVEECGIYFPIAFISLGKSEAKPSPRLEDGRKNCQSSERKRQKMGNS